MLLALAGAAGSGKDSIADVLANEFGYTKLAFAEPLRSLALLNPVYANSLEINGGYENAKRTDPDVREYLIALGEGIRQFSPDYFVDALSIQLDSVTNGNVVITDLRKENEYALLREWGFLFGHVTRPGMDEDGLEWIESIGSYESDRWVTLRNNGSLDQLQDAIRQLTHVSNWARRGHA